MTNLVRDLLIGATAAMLTSVIALGTAATPASAAASPAALGTVRPGMWTIRTEGSSVPHRMCVQDPAMFIQVRHQNSACSRLVLASAARDTTVHYSCPGAGWGRTELRVSSADELRIDTQGIADNAPFAYRAQAHRDGDCRH